MGWLNILKDFQTAIVGFIGFVGVIVTLVVNAIIARRQIRDQRKHERSAIEAALYADLCIHRDSLRRNAEQEMQYGNGHQMYVPAMGTQIFDSNIQKIGLIRAEIIQTLLETYLTLKEYERSLLLISSPSQTGMHRIVSEANAGMYSEMTRNMADQLTDAISEIERHQAI